MDTKSGTGERKFFVFPELLGCERCLQEVARPDLGWDEVDLLIWHRNGHVWPGFAGEPDGGNYGGSDF